MQNCIFFFNPLISNIFRYTYLISKLADCVDKISIRPKFSSPKFGLHFRMFLKYLFCSNTFQNRDNGRCTHFGNRLNQKMNMVLVCPDLQKVYLISLLNLQTYFLQSLIYCFAEYYSAIFGRTYKMIQQYRNIMRFMNVLAFAHTYKDITFTPQAAGN
jgi:hypothetical protein